jgi:hypothetical protein
MYDPMQQTRGGWERRTRADPEGPGERADWGLSRVFRWSSAARAARFERWPRRSSGSI